MFNCPNPPTPLEQEALEEEGRQVGKKDGPGVRFTDGLGALGAGSWSDGPASYRQRGYDRYLHPTLPERIRLLTNFSQHPDFADCPDTVKTAIKTIESEQMYTGMEDTIQQIADEVEALERERQAVIHCLNLFGDSVLHKSLDDAGLLTNKPFA